MQPQYAPPQGYPGYPQPQPQYAPPQPQYAPPPQQQPPAPPAAIAPVPSVVSPTFGEAGPSPSEMSGRMVAFIPIRMTQVDDLSNAGQKKPAVVCDIFVMGTGEFAYGAAPKATPPRPYPTHKTMLPAKFSSQTISSGNLVKALESQVGSGNAVAGIIRESTVGRHANKPWNLDADAAANQAAGALFAGIAQGQVTLGTPQPLVNAAAPVPPQPQYAPPAPAAAPQGYPQQPPAQPQPQYAPPAAPAGYPQQSQYAPPAAPSLPVPPGYDPALWATLTPEQQQIALSQPAVPQAPPNPY